jgi:hypothetical protein
VTLLYAGERGRPITAFAASPLVIVERRGIGRRELSAYVDTADFWTEWQAAEDPFRPRSGRGNWPG